MNNLKYLLTQPLRIVPNSLTIFLLIVSLFGFIDASYLTIEHFLGAIPPCSVLQGCEIVLTSKYAQVFGIPVSLLGSMYYLLIMIGLYTYLDTKNTKYLKFALLLTFPGFIMTSGMMYIMAFILKSYCLYCLGSALTSTILFITTLIILRKYKVEILEQKNSEMR